VEPNQHGHSFVVMGEGGEPAPQPHPDDQDTKSHGESMGAFLEALQAGDRRTRWMSSRAADDELMGTARPPPPPAPSAPRARRAAHAARTSRPVRGAGSEAPGAGLPVVNSIRAG
jgi:hypothetical protein